jgi:hypothetical protein
VTESIQSAEDMRVELKKVAKRLRTTVTAISRLASSNTVPDFITRPEKRKSVNMSSLFSFLSAGVHELVLSRPDIQATWVRSDEDLRDFFRDLAEHTGRSLTAMCEQAGVSLSLPTWVHGSSGAKTMQLDVVLKILSSEGVTVKVRKITPTKRRGRQALIGRI